MSAVVIRGSGGVRDVVKLWLIQPVGNTRALASGAGWLYLGSVRRRTHFPPTEVPSMILVFLAIGLGAGVLSGLFGVGGGVLIVPALIFLIGMSSHSAVGTSLGALLLPVGILGALAYYRSGYLDLRASLLIAVGLFVGAWFGARLALSLSPVQLTRAFSTFLVLVAVRMWLGTLGR